MVKFIPFYILILSLISCNSSYFVTDAKPEMKLSLPAKNERATLIYDVGGLADYVVIGEKTVPHFEENPGFLTYYGQLFGAEKVLWLGLDTVVEFYKWYRECSDCENKLRIIGKVIADGKSVAEMRSSLTWQYANVQERVFYNHHALLLANASGLPKYDRVKSIEIYDANDEVMLASANFDWNEQLESTSGKAYYVTRFMLTQPIGFLKQRNENWESYYNKENGKLKRRNKRLPARYKIKPQEDNSYSVSFNTPYMYAKLITSYYGHHDWTIGAAHADSSYMVNFKLDKHGRIDYMHIVDNLYTSTDEYRVRIYYRDLEDGYPEHWRSGEYILARFKP